MAISVYEVVRVSCQPTTRLTSDANDFVNTKSHAREKSLLAGYSCMNEHVLLRVKVTGDVKGMGHFGLKFFMNVSEKTYAEGLKTCTRIEMDH